MALAKLLSREKIKLVGRVREISRTKSFMNAILILNQFSNCIYSRCEVDPVSDLLHDQNKCMRHFMNHAGFQIRQMNNRSCHLFPLFWILELIRDFYST